jgi:hypothetical protein
MDACRLVGWRYSAAEDPNVTPELRKFRGEVARQIGEMIVRAYASDEHLGNPRTAPSLRSRIPLLGTGTLQSSSAWAPYVHGNTMSPLDATDVTHAQRCIRAEQAELLPAFAVLAADLHLPNPEHAATAYDYIYVPPADLPFDEQHVWFPEQSEIYAAHLALTEG